MHSSRMRTGRSLTVCRALLPGGGGVCLSACWDNPPPEQTTPRADSPHPKQTPPRADTPRTFPPARASIELLLSRHPPELTPPPQSRPRPEWTPPGADSPPPSVSRMTDTSKNITLATTSLRSVKIYCDLKRNPKAMIIHSAVQSFRGTRFCS